MKEIEAKILEVNRTKIEETLANLAPKRFLTEKSKLSFLTSKIAQ